MTSTTQNLTKEVDGGLNHDVFKIVFAGDLNSDEIPDFLLKDLPIRSK